MYMEKIYLVGKVCLLVLFSLHLGNPDAGILWLLTGFDHVDWHLSVKARVWKLKQGVLLMFSAL